LRAYSFVFRLGVLLCLLLASSLVSGWKWGRIWSTGSTTARG